MPDLAVQKPELAMPKAALAEEEAAIHIERDPDLEQLDLKRFWVPLRPD